VFISEFSERSGLSTHTLRYYEKEGLLTDISRNASGKRVYSDRDLTWLTWIQRLKSTGMTLEHIKQFSILRSKGDASITDRKEMLSEHAVKLRSDVDRLKKELSIVEYKIKEYEKKENEVLT